MSPSSSAAGPSSLREATRVTRLDENTFSAHLSPEFCIGTVPNGGYVASILLGVAQAYTTGRGQPDTLAVHWQFLDRTKAGPAVVRVAEAKMGRAVSVLHLTLHQRGLLSSAPWLEDPTLVAPGSRPAARGAEVTAYVTNGNMKAETGITLATGWELSRPPPTAQLALLPLGRDPSWERLRTPLMKRAPMLNKLEYYRLRDGHLGPATQDLWIRLADDGQTFAGPDLGFVVDAVAAMLIEAYRPSTPDAPIAAPGGFPFAKAFWYPTLAMNLEVKKRLPRDGAEWLRLRSWARAVQNGRFDAQMLVFDQHGDLVASSGQVALAIDIERNYASRGSPPKRESKA